jgi:hypothetical protein
VIDHEFNLLVKGFVGLFDGHMIKLSINEVKKKKELANIMEMLKAQSSITMCPIGLSIWYFGVTVQGAVWHIFLFCF